MSTDLVDLEVGNVNPSSIKNQCGCSLMVELQPSKLTTWVRFPSSAPLDNYTNVYVRIFYIKKYFNYLKIHLKVIGYFIILII